MENTLFYVVATSFLVAYVTEVAKSLAKQKFSEKAKKNHPKPSKSFGVAILIIIIR